MLMTKTSLCYDDVDDMNLFIVVSHSNGDLVGEWSVPCLREGVDTYPEHPHISKKKLARVYGEIFYEISGNGDINGANAVYHALMRGIKILGITVEEY